MATPPGIIGIRGPVPPWEIIREEFKTSPYKRNVNPAVMNRVNAMNARLCNAKGEVGLVVDQDRCPLLVRDLEQVRNIPGTRELDKKHNLQLTHASDAIGYFVPYEYPVLAETRRAA